MPIYLHRALIRGGAAFHFHDGKTDRTSALGACGHNSARSFPRRLGLLKGSSDLQGCSQCMEMELGGLKARCPYNSHVKQPGTLVRRPLAQLGWTPICFKTCNLGRASPCSKYGGGDKRPYGFWLLLVIMWVYVGVGVFTEYGVCTAYRATTSYILTACIPT